MRAAIYVRISQDRTGEGLGVGRQLEDCNALAEKLGWTVEEVYRDNDKSAGPGKPRPDYRRLLDDIKAGRIHAVIAWAPDRMYRRLTDLEELCDIIDEYDVQFRAVQAGHVDLATPSGQLVAGMMGVVAKHEGRQKADRWKRAWRQKREAGIVPGGQKLYGYNGSEVVDDEAAIVRELATRVLAGAGLQTLAVDLNQRGILTANGNPWNATRVRRVLLNPRIAGHATLKGQIVGEGNWEPILPDATWRSVRALLSARTRPGAPRVALLSGLVYCARCDLPMQSGRRTDGTRRLRCVKNPRNPGCWSTCPAEPVEDIIEGVAKRCLSRREIRRAVAAAQAGGQTHILAEIDAKERDLVDIQRAIEAGGRHLAMLLSAADTITDRIDQLNTQLSVSAPARIPDDVWQHWPTDLGQRRRLVEIVVARVTVQPAKVKGAPFDPARVDFTPTDLITGAES